MPQLASLRSPQGIATLEKKAFRPLREVHVEVIELRERAKEIPNDYLVVLVGKMITEEGLPTYQTMLNTMDGVRDETGASPSSWAIWTGAWTAEENRHGDLLNKYLYLSGRVDMRQIEKTIQYLIGSGMDPRIENNPYLGFIYTSFEERTSFIVHGNTSRLAKEHGDIKLDQICGTTAGDEKRLESAYTKIVEKLFEIDPKETVVAFEEMMRKKFLMPVHLMYDGRDDNLFDHFSAVAQSLTGLSANGQKAQDYVLWWLPVRIRKLEERGHVWAKEGPTIPFTWIFDWEVNL
ncbi:unnamed protein product [Citrullus colocynthis]|uniref:Acyl-[acyl-carrier-protein] desaturase n=1 Tax=Citrullus colocynthis TaxID=252529 RepID=A0ABP0Y110_9ROSI